MSQNLLNRIVTAIFLLLIIAFFLVKGGAWFLFFMGLAALLLLREAVRLVHLNHQLGQLPRNHQIFNYGAVVIYSAVGITAMADLRLGYGEIPLLLWLIVIVAVTDTAAYATGRTIGGPKLVPRLSPGKTWAGLIGGIMGASLVAYVTLAHAWQAWLLGPCLALCGQGGDLIESWLKRRANVKDSGSLLPGHGGVFDRIDAYLTCAPFLWLIYNLAERMDHPIQFSDAILSLWQFLLNVKLG